MDNPLSFVGAARDSWQFLTLLRSIAGADVIAALFKWDATKVAGSDKITIHKHYEAEYKDRFWYQVEALEDSTWLRFPVIESCAHELVGTVKGQNNSDARYWRWVAPVPGGMGKRGARQLDGRLRRNWLSPQGASQVLLRSGLTRACSERGIKRTRKNVSAPLKASAQGTPCGSKLP